MKIKKQNEDKNLPQVKEDDVKKSEETPVDVKSATVTDRVDSRFKSSCQTWRLVL